MKRKSLKSLTERKSFSPFDGTRKDFHKLPIEEMTEQEKYCLRLRQAWANKKTI